MGLPALGMFHLISPEWLEQMNFPSFLHARDCASACNADFLFIRYCTAVGKYRLCQWPLVQLQDFYYRREAEKAGAFNARKSMLRVGQEMSSLATSLPIAWATSIFLVADDNRMDIIRCVRSSLGFKI